MSGGAGATAEPARFRALMGRWATGVAVVTAHADVDAGLTVNSLVSIALDPPTVMISLQDDVDTLPVLARGGWFAVSFLAADQRGASERFARMIPTAEKFAGIPVRRGPNGSPILEGHVGAMECRVVDRRTVQDHVLVLGEVAYVEAGRDAPPLVYLRSGYAEAEGPDRLRLPPPRG